MGLVVVLVVVLVLVLVLGGSASGSGLGVIDPKSAQIRPRGHERPGMRDGACAMVGAGRGRRGGGLGAWVGEQTGQGLEGLEGFEGLEGLGLGIRYQSTIDICFRE